jgi:hypothetical protein
LGPDAATTLSREWKVQSRLEITSVAHFGNDLALHFLAVAGNSYTLQYKDSLSAGNWSKLSDVPDQRATEDYAVIDHGIAGQSRFYTVVTPIQP